MPDTVPWPGTQGSSMAFSHLCWQLSHLGRGEVVLSTQYDGQDALAHLSALCVTGLPSYPAEAGGLAGMSSSGVRPGVHL